MKILFIACYSPLINNSASIETLQYLNNLARINGNEVHLLTVNFPKNSVYYDEYIFSMLDKRVKLHIISGGKVFEKIMPKKNNNVEATGSDKGKSKGILRAIKGAIAIPDMYLNWALKASKYGIKLMEKENFDVMFSMHEPPSSHICAYRIKNKFKSLPWITYWSDPWLKDSTREGSSITRKYIEGSLEKKVILNADKFIFVTKANRDDYIKSYNIAQEKTYLITRGYEREVYENIKKEEIPNLIKKDKINLVYAGEIFSKLRDVRPFISAIKKIEAENKDLYNELNILFFGNIDDEGAKEELKALNVVKVSNRIPYNEALAYMVNSDILLLFGNKNSKQIPAKIYDYYGCDGYILVMLGDEKDPIIQVTEGRDKCRVVLNKEDSIKNSIYDLIEKVEKGEKSHPIEEYEWENISKKLNLILKE
ncbi:glycosyl transferase group 1 [Clostridium sp.]|uniref:glycosyl transferase group 1 n=1 Tax=Clostridium sp. TaxID=1506 RepID=UPI003F404205